MPSEDSKSVKKEEEDEDNKPILSGLKKKLSNANANGTAGSAKSRAKVKKEETEEHYDNDDDNKPLAKRNSITKPDKVFYFTSLFLLFFLRLNLKKHRLFCL
jgi:hypothetical protein